MKDLWFVCDKANEPMSRQGQRANNEAKHAIVAYKADELDKLDEANTTDDLANKVADANRANEVVVIEEADKSNNTDDAI